MKNKIFWLLGILYILAGVILNFKILGYWLAWDGKIEEPSAKIFITLFDALLILWGALTLLGRKKNLIVNLNLLLISFLVFGPFLGEGFLRAGIALNIPWLKILELYGGYSNDDEWWVLQNRWRNELKAADPDFIHPLLGWSQGVVGKANPYGLYNASLEKIHSDRKKIFFYGDSFVRGRSDPEFFIPEQMQRAISDREVVDLSVGGYGVDQTYLMFKETHHFADNGLILFGLLTEDIDRVVLRVRTTQKPYFVWSRTEGLSLKGVPIEKDQKAYFQRRYKKIFFLAALMKQKIMPSSWNNKRQLKEKISREILNRGKKDCVDLNQKMIAVIFYEESELRKKTRKEEFLKASLNEIGIDFISTKEILLDYARKYHLKTSAFYVADDGHHNNLGNQVIAEGILRELRQSKNITGPSKTFPEIDT